MIQPAPYGSWLISSGRPPRSALPATISPLDRAVDVRRGLDRFDDRAGLAGHDASAGVRRLDEHQVAERLLRVVGDADGHGAVGLEPRPLVALAGTVDRRELCSWTSLRQIRLKANGDRAVAHEGRPHHACRQQPSRGSRLRSGRRSPRARRARPIERSSVGRKRAARDLALADGGHDHLLMRAEHAAVLEQQPDQLARRARGLLRAPARRGR